MGKKVIIEVRANEWSLRARNPNVPWTAGDFASDAEACRKAGASIYHFHARNPDGSASHDPKIYGAAIRAIRERTDILIHPTLAGVITPEGRDRIGPVLELARDPATLPDFAPMDMGSTNLDAYDPAAKAFTTEAKTYVNTIKTLAFLGNEIRSAGMKQLLCVWTVPCWRAIDAFIDMGRIPEPAFACVVLTEGGILGGHPGTIKGLESVLEFLPAGRQIEWSVCCREGNLFPAASAALERGGHVSIGLGDYAYPELGKPTNAELVREITGMARLVGREPATPADTRSMLGMK